MIFWWKFDLNFAACQAIIRKKRGRYFLIIHCTHYQHSDWPRAPSLYFKNSHDFVDKHDYGIICYPIISFCRLYHAQCICLIHLWPKSASTWMVLSDAGTWCVCPCIFGSAIKIYLHFTWQFLYIFHKTMYNKTMIEFGFCDIWAQEV